MASARPRRTAEADPAEIRRRPAAFLDELLVAMLEAYTAPVA